MCVDLAIHFSSANLQNPTRNAIFLDFGLPRKVIAYQTQFIAECTRIVYKVRQDNTSRWHFEISVLWAKKCSSRQIKSRSKSI